MQVFQNQAVFNLYHQINAYGFGKVAETHPELEAALSVSRRGSKSWDTSYFKHYALVAELSTASMDEAFDILNGYGDMTKIVSKANSKSMSVGDIIKTASGVYYIVDGVGFTEIEVQ